MRPTPRRASNLSSIARLWTTPAFVFSLIGPGSVLSGMLSPVFTMLTIAIVTLSMNALMSASLLPDTATSFAMATCATVNLLSDACFSSSAIVAYAYFGWPFFGGSYPFHSMKPPPTE